MKIAVLLRVVSLCLVMHAQLARSADVAVTSDADTGANTLRDALATANDGDTIVFALPAGSTISLASGLTVTKHLSIDGAGSPGLTISGNHAVTVLTINGPASAKISNLTIADGPNGILAVGALTLLKCTVRGSTTGIYSYGTLIVANSTILGNSTPTVGGGIYIYAGSATITNNSFVNNFAHRGGAIASTTLSLSTVTNNLFQGNSVTQFGAAIYDDYNGKVSADHNLYWNNLDPSGQICYGCASDTNATLADPLLDSLGDHGGPTQTFFPGYGSAAIDAGDDATCAAAPVTNVDQRGGVRPFGSHCDIGAVESDDPVFADGFELPVI
jgi:predicted outer membrane repeat protein